MNSGAIFVGTNAGESEAVNYIQPETAANGLIVVDVHKFRAFVERLKSPELKEARKNWESIAGKYLGLYDEYRALRAAYENKTGEKWVYQDGEDGNEVEDERTNNTHRQPG